MADGTIRPWHVGAGLAALTGLLAIASSARSSRNVTPVQVRPQAGDVVHVATVDAQGKPIQVPLLPTAIGLVEMRVSQSPIPGTTDRFEGAILRAAPTTDPKDLQDLTTHPELRALGPISVRYSMVVRVLRNGQEVRA